MWLAGGSEHEIPFIKWKWLTISTLVTLSHKEQPEQGKSSIMHLNHI